MVQLGSLELHTVARKRVVKLSDLKPGVNDVGAHFIRISEAGEVVHVIDKVCDHAGGRLILKGAKALCPIHGWELDLESLRYNSSHVRKKPAEYELDGDGNIHIIEHEGHLVDPFKGPKQGTVKLRWLNHATVHIECNGITLITDPWLFGPAFMTGWWLATPSPEESIHLLKNADHIFISHNHPDHLHAETLAVLSRDKKILVADFMTRSCEKYLRSLGFTNIHPLGFKAVHELGERFHISVLKSGDFRDDAGAYICANGHSFLLTVDCNFLNHLVLPRGLDLLLTSFAGGASGFPLCFDDYSEAEQQTILDRNKASIRFLVANYLKATLPKYYMPYAGMFSEQAPRDAMVKRRNAKNTVADYQAIASATDTELIPPRQDRSLIFRDGVLEVAPLNTTPLLAEDPAFYIAALQREYPYSAATVIRYLKRSGYKGDRIVHIIPTDNDFVPIGEEAIHADFSKGLFRTMPLQTLECEVQGMRVMQLRIRSEVLMCVVENSLPWEDFSIGFQMRITRIPNEYESDLWYHFTNVYIADHHFRHSSFCGACTVIDQNPIWARSHATQGPRS